MTFCMRLYICYVFSEDDYCRIDCGSLEKPSNSAVTNILWSRADWHIDLISFLIVLIYEMFEFCAKN